MAKQIGEYKIKGTVGDITFYKMEGEWYARRKSGLSRERVKRAKEFMRTNNVEFTEIDVSTDRDRAKEMIEKSGQMGVPVIVVGEGEASQLIIGFDQPRLAEVLGL